MESPTIQYAIRLINFLVTSVNLKITDPLDNTLTLSIAVNAGFTMGFSEEDKHRYSVNFNIELTNSSDTFKLELKAVAVFESKEEIDDDFKQSSFIQTNSPAISFPFVRSYINTLTTNSGISPVILPAFNFSKANH